ncbi:hypothetical protein KKC44_01525 [Patescibacteria group bacterium]|nr:hypothetical protein [Patescibacteria group bacterium]
MESAPLLGETPDLVQLNINPHALVTLGVIIGGIWIAAVAFRNAFKSTLNT